MLYFAYGSNLHQEQMKRRCSGCKYLKKYILQDYRLTFRSELCVADIEYKKGSSVQGALYEITDKDETCLDKYEDFPILYTKLYFKYYNKKVMSYIMVRKSKFRYPTEKYLNVIKQGYKDCNLDKNYLRNALKNIK